MNDTLFAIGAYVLVQLIIGFVVSRRVKTETDYVLAGRSFGYLLATFSIFATWFGAETCIGSAAAIYSDGLSAAAHDPLGYAACILLMGAVFAVPLWRQQLTTLSDLFRRRYGTGVEKLATLMMVPTSLIWAGAQVRAFGQVLASASPLTTDVAVGLAAMVVIAYTMMGGLLADAVTDVLQGGMLLVGLVVVFVAVLSDIGGLGPAAEMIDAERLTLFPREASAGLSLLHNMEAWLVPICGSVVAQELIARTLASRSPQVARRSAFMATGIYLSLGCIPLFLGLIGPALVPGLEDAEHLLPELVRRHTSHWIYILFTGALVSAILSTVDSAILAASTLTTENLLGLRRGRAMSETAKLRLNRGCVLVFGIVAYLFARFGGNVFELVEDASSFGSAGIFTLLVFGLFTTWGRKFSAFAALSAGMGVWLLGEYVAGIEFAYVLALASAIGVYCLGGFFEPRFDPAELARSPGGFPVQSPDTI